MKKPIIAIAGFQHETNTFNPKPTTIKDFEKQDGWPKATRGKQILNIFKNINIALSGFIADAENLELKPILWCSAEPGGNVKQNAFQKYTNEICEKLQKIKNLDGILLDLHGAMVTEKYDDGELEIIRKIRHTVGNIPIVTALDFHANLSQEMINLTDAVTIYRHYPHTDMRQTGQRAAKIIKTILKNNQPIHQQFRKIPYLIPLTAQATQTKPIKAIYQNIKNLKINGLINIDAAAGFPPADIPNCGPSIVAFAQNQTAAKHAADTIEKQFLNAEKKFKNPIIKQNDAIKKAINLLKKHRKPIIIADAQDNAGAGATSDTTGILQKLTQLDAAPAIIGIIADKKAVKKAHKIKKNTNFKHILGQKSQIPKLKRQKLTFKTLNTSDKTIKCKGTMYKNINVNIGKTALLKIIGTKHDILVAIAEERFQCLDRALLEHYRINLKENRIIVVKSTVHFMDDFNHITDHIIFAESPGLSHCRPENVTYQKLPKEIRIIR